MKMYSMEPQPMFGPNGFIEDGDGYAIRNESGWKIGEAIERDDAQLWIAAPDLLAACKLALGAFEHGWAIDWDELREAIEKAEGAQ